MPPVNTEPKRKKVALALSGCAGRAIAYIGIMEVFAENNIPINAIAACSSGALVACAYASHKLPALKSKVFSLTAKDILSIFEPTFKSGLLSLDKLDQAFAEFVIGENLEDLHIPVAVVASDIVEGKEVVFRMGNTIRAIKASCSMPGIFEPVIWGDKILVDGGLFNIAPVEAAKEFGMDVVIGIDMAESRNLFGQTLVLRSSYNFIKRPFAGIGSLPKKIKKFVLGKTNVAEYTTIDNLDTPGLMKVLTTAMDWAIRERRKNEYLNCDLMIRPEVNSYNKLTNTDFENLYAEGRRVALAALPQIKELLSK